MTSAEDVEGGPHLAMPPRPAHRLSTLQVLRVGQSNTLAACDEELFDELFLERRFLWYRVFLVSDPDGIRRVLRDNWDNYPRVDQIRRIFAFGSGTGMLCAEGEASRRHRRMINPIIDHRAVQADLPELIRLAEDFAEDLGRLPPGQEINIGEAVSRLVTRASGQIFAGPDRTVDPMLDRLARYPGRYSRLDALVPDWLRFGVGTAKSRAAARALGPQIDRLIGERRSPDYPGARDLMWRLVHASDRRTGDRFSDDELRDEALTLGSTAATTMRPLSWIWYLLALHPWAEERLHAELDAVLGGRTPSPEDLPRLVYLRQIIDETMRLYPPLPVMLRVAAADDMLCGRRIPRRAIVVIMPWVVHRHRKLWEHPDRFDPDRFAPEAAAARSRYTYLPFSVGPHVCVAASLAMHEMVIAVAILAQHFRFRLVPGHPVEPTAWTNLRPRFGIRVTIEPRQRLA